jgi:hypothetical protein
MSTLTDYFNSRSSKAVQAPVPVAYDTDTDASIRKAWGLSLAEWDGMKDLDRAWHRWNVTKAPNFSTEGK